MKADYNYFRVYLEDSYDFYHFFCIQLNEHFHEKNFQSFLIRKIKIETDTALKYEYYSEFNGHIN